MKPPTVTTIREEFAVHRLNAGGLALASQVAASFSRLLSEIEQVVPPGRERALVVTKLQEAAFFAKRAIALDPKNQEKP